MQIDKGVVQLEIIIDWVWFFIFGQGEDSFFKQLKQYLIQFVYLVGNVEEVFYYMFNWLVVVVFIVQLVGYVELVVEKQMVVIVCEFEMQCEMDVLQLMQIFIEFIVFGFGQKVEVDYFIY